MRRSLIILAMIFLLAGCPNDDDSSNGTMKIPGNDLYIETNGTNGTEQPTVVPEPATLALFGLGAAGLAALKLKRRKNG